MAAKVERRVLFVTYTMANPYAVGVFFRALRLSCELHKRGWIPFICNRGPLPEDPKMDLAKDACRIFSIEADSPAEDFEKAVAMFRGIAPDVVVFGETPLPFLLPLYDAVRTLRAPLLVLDQYYSERLSADRTGVDLFLLYGLHALWKDPPRGRRGLYKVVPPFIEEVTPKERLAAPAQYRNLRWLTIAGFDRRVLEGGIALAAALNDPSALVITVSHRPEAAARLMEKAGIPASRRLALPLLSDADLFGYMAASRALVLANGFMQIMEGLALGCPVICIDRGIGMDGWGLHDTFAPFVSIEEPPAEQLRRLRGWMERCPFSPEQLDALRGERGGLRQCAGEIENAAAHPRFLTRLARTTARLRLRAGTRVQTAL
jgi:hypothetical protein